MSGVRVASPAFFLPKRNAEEAAAVLGLAACQANSLSEAVNFLRGETPLGTVADQPGFVPDKIDDDLAEPLQTRIVTKAIAWRSYD
ncbi:MAG: hypothetical protein JO025_18880 [Verrucomicrobia bacterium]|nr:hypothetical protein [Verrucomicrobiota bacterium]